MPVKSWNGLMFVLSVLSCFSSVAQDTSAIHYSTYIQPEIIRRHLSVLASDSLEGRETATAGMEKAARYVSQQFASYGIPPANKGSYFQEIPLVREKPLEMQISISEKKFIYGDDYFPIDGPPELAYSSNEIIFAGFGIDDSASGWNDYKDLDVAGKTLMILDGEPINKKGISLISGKKESSKWKNDRQKKISLALDKKASVVILIHQDYKKTFERMGKRIASGKLLLDNEEAKKTVPVIYISMGMGDYLLKKSNVSITDWQKKVAKKRKTIPFIIQEKIFILGTSEKTSCKNVLAYIEGTTKKDELIVITAHLDHLGKRDDKIYYGADDDGSGSSSILNIAEAFSIAKKEGRGSKRSILVMTFTGEEKGLFGSEYYTDNPVFPMSNTVANLNIDMIGRVDTIQRESKYYSYIIGSDKLSTQLHQINETSNKSCCNLELDYRYNDPSDKLKLYYRSDHYNFAKNNIPVIFYFTGLHEDYHKPSDTIDKIDFDKTARIAKLVFNTAWELANKEERIVVDVKNVFK